MSKFFSAKFSVLTPYTPGEQPKDAQYIKLNTNESPYPLPQSAVDSAAAECKKCRLYSDPECTLLTRKAEETLGVKKGQVLMTNGSDEALLFAFTAFCDETRPVVFPDISYGFYSVFANLHSIPYRTVALKEDFSIDYKDYLDVRANVVLANPNAPTGLALPLNEVEEIVKSNPEYVVVIDEAYVDFGGESAVTLIDKYDNLLVTQTFSKSRSLAGGRLGMAIGNEKLIADLQTIKYSTNPYNVNRMTAAAGYAALCEKGWFERNVAAIKAVREETKAALEKLGFVVLPSKTNFLFVKSDRVDGQTLYEKLKARGVLVRHFQTERIKDFNRVTVGTKEEMQAFLQKVEEILAEAER